MGNHVPKEFWGSLTHRLEDLEARMDSLHRAQRDALSQSSALSAMSLRVDSLSSTVQDLGLQLKERPLATCPQASEPTLLGQHPAHVLLGLLGCILVLLLIVLWLRSHLSSQVRRVQASLALLSTRLEQAETRTDTHPSADGPQDVSQALAQALKTQNELQELKTQVTQLSTGDVFEPLLQSHLVQLEHRLKGSLQPEGRVAPGALELLQQQLDELRSGHAEQSQKLSRAERSWVEGREQSQLSTAGVDGLALQQAMARHWGEQKQACEIALEGAIEGLRRESEQRVGELADKVAAAGVLGKKLSGMCEGMQGSIQESEARDKALGGQVLELSSALQELRGLVESEVPEGHGGGSLREQMAVLADKTGELQSQLDASERSVHSQMQELAGSLGLAQEPGKQQVTSFLGHMIQQRIEDHTETGAPEGPPEHSGSVNRSEMQQGELATSNSSDLSKSRRERLASVFQEFDLNNSGSIGADELLELGKARRTLGQAGGEWTPEQSKRLIQKMDRDADGLIGVEEFVEYFDEVLPEASEQFDSEVERFMEVAGACRSQMFDPIYDVILHLQREVSQNKAIVDKELTRIKRQVGRLQRSINQEDY